MHPHAELVDRLYRSLGARDHATMAECYHADATFEDIAFRLEGNEQIHNMWRFVTRDEPQLKATFGIIRVKDDTVHAWLIDDYIFTGPPAMPVSNVILSFFRVREDRIIEHRDVCDPIRWASMAMTGPKAWLAGRFRLVRSLAARRKLREFLSAESPQPQAGGH